jgi:YidC/Oxa1 family membrane protein insertase
MLTRRIVSQGLLCRECISRSTLSRPALLDSTCSSTESNIRGRRWNSTSNSTNPGEWVPNSAVSNVLTAPSSPHTQALSSSLPKDDLRVQLSQTPDITAITTTNETAQSFHDVGLGTGWGPISWIENAFEYLHASTGLPWWACIIVGTVVLKGVHLPFIIKGQRGSAGMMKLTPQINGLMKDASKAAEEGNNQKVMRLREEVAAVYKKNKVSPMGFAWNLAQAPAIYCVFRALTAMSNPSAPAPGFITGGAYWFTNLTLADPFAGLGFGAALTTYLAIRLNRQQMSPAQAQNPVAKLLPLLSGLMIPISLWVPSSISLMFFTNSCLQFLQLRAFQSAAIRRFLNIPDPLTPDEQAKIQQSGGSSFSGNFSQMINSARLQAKQNEKERKEREVHVAFQKKAESRANEPLSKRSVKPKHKN